MTFSGQFTVRQWIFTVIRETPGGLRAFSTDERWHATANAVIHAMLQDGQDGIQLCPACKSSERRFAGPEVPGFTTCAGDKNFIQECYAARECGLLDA